MRDHSIRFRSELFDYKGEIPEDANAGNRFYGRDVAEFLAKGLNTPSWNMGFIDEDWGWMTSGKFTDGKFIEIAIYNLSSDGTPGQNGTNEWGLWVRAFEKCKWLLIFSRSTEIECPADLVAALDKLLREAGINAVEWHERTHDAA